jgi:site-specific DNA recombinase
VTTITADLYLRLSDFRVTTADSFPARAAALRAKAAELGWKIHAQPDGQDVIIENDLADDGRRKSASAFKRRKITTPSGRVELRTIRPGFRKVIADLESGAVNAVLTEDLDRLARDPRDMEDLIDAVYACKGQARSISGSLTLTDGGTSDEHFVARTMCNVANKASADTARRVANGRERTAALGSYGGGRRPFGFRADPDAPKYAKTLIINEDEAQVIRDAAAAVLADDESRLSLRFLAAQLRRSGVPTVTGVPWTARTLKDVLVKPAVAGILVHSRTGVETEGAWPCILEPERWKAVRDELTRAGRRSNHDNANTPVWLGSGIYRCGVCGDGTSVSVNSGRGRSPTYVCKAHAHLRRTAIRTDAYVGMVVCDVLARYPEMLRPVARPEVDTAALRREQKRLEGKARKLDAQWLQDAVSDRQLHSMSREIKAKLDQIAMQLAATAKPDPFPEFDGATDRDAIEAIWDDLSLLRKRNVLARSVVVTLLPTGRCGSGFNSDSVRVQKFYKAA